VVPHEGILVCFVCFAERVLLTGQLDELLSDFAVLETALPFGSSSSLARFDSAAEAGASC
jgi:hypothetical protein